MEVKRRRSSNFWARGLLSATGVCVWWGAFHPVWWHPPTYDREQDFQLHARKWKWILGKDSLESFIFVQNYLISIILRQDCLHESESGVDSSLFSESVVLIVFYLQYLKRSRLTWKCSSNKPNSERQPLIAVKRDNIKHVLYSCWKVVSSSLQRAQRNCVF